MYNRLLLLEFILLLVTIDVYGQGRQDSVQTGARIRIEGIVRMVGNEPFTSLVVTDASGQDWFIDLKDQKTLLAFQQQRVTIEGTLTVQKQILADGRELPPKKIVSEIRVIKN